MSTKRHNKLKLAKIKNNCSFCCSVCSSHNSIHIKCIDEYLTKNGYIILANPLTTQDVEL